MSRGGELVGGKTVRGFSLSGKIDPSLCLAWPGALSWDPGVRCIRLNWSLLRFPNLHGKEQSSSDQSTLTGWTIRPLYWWGVLSASTENSVVSTARAAREACVLRLLRRVSFGYGTQSCAEGVASIRPCGGTPSSTGLLASGGMPGPKRNHSCFAGREDRQN